MNQRAFLFAALLLLGLAAPSRSAALIYSARYYNPPGSRLASSHFHLYMMKVGSHGHSRPRQLTFGLHDDSFPEYSPDRRWILFKRDENHAVCVMRANGGAVRTLDTTNGMMDAGFWSASWWPTRDLVFIPASSKKPARLVRMSDGKAVKSLGMIDRVLMAPSGQLAWREIGDQTVICRVHGLDLIPVRKDNSYRADWLTSTSLVTFSCSRGPTSTNEMNIIQIDGTKSVSRPIPVAQVIVNAAVPDAIQCIPGVSAMFLVGLRNTHRERDFYWIDAKTGRATPWLMHKAFVKFDGATGQYVTAGDDTVPYGPDKTVWGGDLLLGVSLGDLHPRTIVRGPVEVDGADWR